MVVPASELWSTLTEKHYVQANSMQKQFTLEKRPTKGPSHTSASWMLSGNKNGGCVCKNTPTILSTCAGKLWIIAAEQVKTKRKDIELRLHYSNHVHRLCHYIPPPTTLSVPVSHGARSTLLDSPMPGSASVNAGMVYQIKWLDHNASPSAPLITQLEYRTMVTHMEHRTMVAQLEHRTMVTQLGYRTMVTQLGYRTMVTQLEYRTIVTQLEYRTMVTQLKYRTMVTQLEYRTMVTQLETVPITQSEYRTTDCVGKVAGNGRYMQNYRQALLLGGAPWFARALSCALF